MSSPVMSVSIPSGVLHDERKTVMAGMQCYSLGIWRHRDMIKYSRGGVAARFRCRNEIVQQGPLCVGFRWLDSGPVHLMCYTEEWNVLSLCVSACSAQLQWSVADYVTTRKYTCIFRACIMHTPRPIKESGRLNQWRYCSKRIMKIG